MVLHEVAHVVFRVEEVSQHDVDEVAQQRAKVTTNSATFWRLRLCLPVRVQLVLFYLVELKHGTVNQS